MAHSIDTWRRECAASQRAAVRRRAGPTRRRQRAEQFARVACTALVAVFTVAAIAAIFVIANR